MKSGAPRGTAIAPEPGAAERPDDNEARQGGPRGGPGHGREIQWPTSPISALLMSASMSMRMSMRSASPLLIVPMPVM